MFYKYSFGFLQLFGQKWSSSVPLFAQTLSFSPLTPAKSAGGGGNDMMGSLPSPEILIPSSSSLSQVQSADPKIPNDVPIPSVRRTSSDGNEPEVS